MESIVIEEIVMTLGFKMRGAIVLIIMKFIIHHPQEIIVGPYMNFSPREPRIDLPPFYGRDNVEESLDGR